MKHHFLDQYSNLRSPVHALDPRVKIITLFSFLFFVIFTPITQAPKFALYGALVFSTILISRIPLEFVLKRSLVIVPFVLLVAIGLPFLGSGDAAGSYNISIFRITHSALLIFLNVLVKSWLCVFPMIVLTATTPFPKLLNGFQRLKLPKIFIMILSFMYRFIFIFIDEFGRMCRARDARAPSLGRIQHIKIVGCMIGTLFARSYERGERVYTAMRSRGFNGEIKLTRELEFKRFDALFFASFFSLLILILVVV